MSKIDPDEIRKLSPDGRLQPIDEMWDALDEDDLGPLTDELRTMLDERIAAFMRSPEEGASWEEMRARLLALE